MSVPEHRRRSVVDDIRDRCLDCAARLSPRVWQLLGAGLLVLLVISVVTVMSTRGSGLRDASAHDLPRASTSTVASSVTSDGEVVVHVSGAVVRPGVYRLPVSARLVDAIDEAGGLAPDADTERVNLAAKLLDGQSVYVVRKGQTSVPQVLSSPAGAPNVEGVPVDLNVANESDLDELPGVGPATAKAIVEFRTKHGSFRSVDDLGKVRGIGPAKLAELRPHVRV